MPIGKIISISDLNVEIFTSDKSIKIRDILSVEVNGVLKRFEVVELKNSIVYAIPFDNVIGLKRGMEVSKFSDGLKIQYNDEYTAL